MEQIQQWRALADLGVPLLLLVALIAALVKAMKWIAPRAERVIAAHVSLVEVLRDTTGRNTNALEQNARSSEALVGVLETTRRSLGHGAAALWELSDGPHRQQVRPHLEKLLAELELPDELA